MANQEINDVRSLSRELNNVLQTQSRISDKLSNQLDITQQTNKVLRDIEVLNRLNEKHKDNETIQLRIQAQLSNKDADIKRLIIQRNTKNFELNDKMNELSSTALQIQNEHGRTLKMMGIEHKSIVSMQEIQNKLADGEVDKANILIRIAELQNEQVQGIANGTIQRLDYSRELLAINQQFPNLSGAELANVQAQLNTLQGVNDTYTEIQDNGRTHAENLAEQNKYLQTQLDSISGISEKANEYWNNFRTILQNPKIAAGLAFAALAHQAGRFFSTIEDTRKELGLSIGDGIEMSKSISGAALSGMLLGISLTESAAAAKAIVEETNSIGALSVKNVKQVALLNSRYGVSVTTAAKLQTLYKQINGNSSEIANNQLDSFVTLAETSGLPVGKLMEEVASNTEFFALHAKNGGANLRNAAAMSLKLGIGMSEVAAISDNLLNIDSSIENEMQASVLLGRQLNLNKAREFALLDDQEGMMKEIINNLGSINEWENLNVIEKRAFADAVGIGADKLQTMIANQAEVNRLASTQTSEWDRTWFGIKQSISGLKEYKEVALTSLNAMGSIAMIAPKLFSGAGNILGKGISKIGGKFGSIIERIKGMSKSVELPGDDAKNKGKGLAGWFEGWNSVDTKSILKFALATGVLIAALPLLAFGLKQFTEVPWDAALIGMGSLLSMTLIMKLIGNQVGSVIKGSIAVAVLSAALIPLGYGLKQFTDIDTSSLINAGVAIGVFTAAVFGLGAILTSGIGAVMFGAGIIGFIALGGAMTVLGLSLQVVSSAMAETVTSLSMLLPLTSQLAELAPEMVAIGAGFASMGAGLLTLSLGAMALTPFLPVLEKLTSVTGESNTEQAKPITKETDKVDTLMTKMDTLIDLMIKGGTIKLNDREIGTWLGLKMDTIKTYNV